MSISPGLEAAIAKLAKLTVQNGWDPGKVLAGLVQMTKLINELTPEQRAAVRRELRRRRDDA